MTVAGVPGSGKTAGLTSFLLPVALSEDVELNIIDGKGGHDWAAYKPICGYYSNDDEDLQAMKDYLEAAVEDMRERVQTMPEKLGVANFWSASLERRRAAGVKHKIIVIDECQNYFEKRTGDKEATALTQEIVRLATSLVKKGRSAGITLIATTQKPTADSLPTGLRDNCALKICFRVTTKEAQKAALGDIDLDDSNNALSIKKAGGAIILAETGHNSRVRFFYMEPHVQERLINDEVSKRNSQRG